MLGHFHRVASKCCQMVILCNFKLMPEISTDSNKRNLRNLILFLLPAIVSASIVYSLWTLHPDIEYWKQVLISGRHFLETHTWALILSLLLLPGIGTDQPPLDFIQVVMVPVCSDTVACLIAIATQSCCTVWTYVLSAGPLREFLRRYVLRNRALPEMTPRNALRLGLIIRITPGFPYALQNIVLGVLGIPFAAYLLVSLPIASLYTIVLSSPAARSLRASWGSP